MELRKINVMLWNVSVDNGFVMTFKYIDNQAALKERTIKVHLSKQNLLDLIDSVYLCKNHVYLSIQTINMITTTFDDSSDVYATTKLILNGDGTLHFEGVTNDTVYDKQLGYDIYAAAFHYDCDHEFTKFVIRKACTYLASKITGVLNMLECE